MDSREEPVIDVSVILASYNAANYLEENFRQILNVLDATVYKYEIIFVDDKSADSTVQVIKQLIQGKPNCRLYEHTENLGRGATVCDGFKKARGDIIGFIDLDLDNPARYIFSMILGIKKGEADVATALRVYYFSKKNPYLLFRLLISKAYARIASLWMGTSLKDTETGCKFFKRDKLMTLMEETRDHGWFWDTEIMVRAYYHGYRIIEIPTLFIRDTNYSTVNLLPDSLRYLRQLWNFWPVKEQLKLRLQATRKSQGIF